MKKTKLIILLLSISMLFAWQRAFAVLTVDVEFGTDPAYDGIEGAIKNELENNQLKKYSDLPDFVRGFANANTYAATNGVTMRGYQGYDIICLAVGTMATVQAPDASPLFYQKIQDELDNGDVYTGLGVNPVAGQVGLNMSFIIPDLYLAFRFGKLDYKIDAGSYKLDYNTNLLGIIVDYQLIPSKSILAGLLSWKGLNVESGFIYSTNNAVYYKDLDPINITNGPVIALIDPSVDLEIDIKSYIIPIELYSAFRLFYMINFGAGIGLDYVYKNTTELTIHSAGDAVITDNGGVAGITNGDTGIMTVHAGTKNEADKYRPKLMVNVGAGMGPVFVDVPLTFYVDNGYAVGVSAGIVW